MIMCCVPGCIKRSPFEKHSPISQLAQRSCIVWRNGIRNVRLSCSAVLTRTRHCEHIAHYNAIFPKNTFLGPFFFCTREKRPLASSRLTFLLSDRLPLDGFSWNLILGDSFIKIYLGNTDLVKIRKQYQALYVSPRAWFFSGEIKSS